MADIFTKPWAVNGDKTTIPTNKQTDGMVSFEEGFGEDYEKSLLSDPDAKNIDRKKLNYLFNVICSQLNVVAAKAGAIIGNTAVGSPFPYPISTLPAGHLSCNGGDFDKDLYPDLFKLYPDGKVPDLRGEFIRGWDNGRGIDTGRELLSAQGDAIRNITGQFANNGLAYSYGIDTSVGIGAFMRIEGADTPSNYRNDGFGCRYTFDASRVVPTAEENRPRNVAFHYIMRAK